MATRYTQPQAGPLVPSREWAPRFVIVPAGAGLADATLPGAASTMIGGASVMPAQGGLALDLSGSTSYATLPASDNYNILGPLTLVWYGVIKNLSQYNFLLSSAAGAGASNNPFELRVDPNGAATITRANASFYTQSTASAIPIGVPVCIVVTHGADLATRNGAIYANGVAYGFNTGIAGGAGPAGGNTNALMLGTRGDLYSYAKTQTLLAAGFDRVLTADQAAALSANPWQLLQTPRRVFRVSGGGTPATVTPSGISATASVGTPTSTGAATAQPPGVAASSAVGTPTATAAAKAYPAGVASVSAIGTPIATGGTPATATPAGVSATSAVGTPTAQGAAAASPSGVQVASAVGVPIASGAAMATPAGVQGASAVGTPAASGGTPATVTPAGVQGTASVGTPVATGSAVANPSGVQAATATGTPTATGSALASPAGVQVASAVGTPTASAGMAIPATAYPPGVQASSAVGAPLATGAAIAIPPGVLATSATGVPGATGGAMAYLGGAQALSFVGVPAANSAALAYATGVQVLSAVGMPAARIGAIEFGAPLIINQPPRNWTARQPPRNWTTRKG